MNRNLKRYYSKEIKECTTKSNFGFMGATWPCRSHANGFAGIKNTEFKAICEPDIQKREAFVKTFGKMAEFDDYRQMLKKAELDAVIIWYSHGHAFSCLAGVTKRWSSCIM